MGTPKFKEGDSVRLNTKRNGLSDYGYVISTKRIDDNWSSSSTNGYDIYLLRNLRRYEFTTDTYINNNSVISSWFSTRSLHKIDNLANNPEVLTTFGNKEVSKTLRAVRSVSKELLADAYRFKQFRRSLKSGVKEAIEQISTLKEPVFIPDYETIKIKARGRVDWPSSWVSFTEFK